MVEPKSLDKYITYKNGRSADDFVNETHSRIYNDSITNQAQFFAKQAEDVFWHKKFTQVLDTSDKYLHRWYPDGEINICFNAIDRHIVSGHGDATAFLEDSVYTGKQKAWTYKELQEKTGKLASVLRRKFNVQAGDRVIIYMPMVVEAAVAMLACARIGAIHSVVFGGFAAKELANRIDDCHPKLIIVSSCGIEPGKYIKYVPIVEQALGYCTKIADAHKSIPRLLIQRNELDGKLKEVGKIDQSVYFDYDSLMEQETEIAECVALRSNHPLYILYTSGTTGQPKGIVRDTGGTVVALNFCMENVFNVHRGSVHFASSDVGWVVGHSFIVYGPLIRGAKCVFFEGKPVVPNAGVMW